MGQLEKNTVKAENQLKDNDYIRFHIPENADLRVMFVGNSITLHGINHDIGWHNFWGMADSAEEKDYVHVMMEEIKKNHPNTAFCVCQGSKWEVAYRNGTDVFPQYEMARDFNADIIVIRLVENTKVTPEDRELFLDQYGKMVDFLNKSGNAKLVITDGFWYHPADSFIEEFAATRNLPLVKLGDLGEQEIMRATGLFEHSGVAAHPGDLGMKNIADRILACMYENKMI